MRKYPGLAGWPNRGRGFQDYASSYCCYCCKRSTFVSFHSFLKSFCVCVCCAHSLCIIVWVYMWRPEVGIWCLPQLFDTLFLRQFACFLKLNLDLADYISWTSQQSLGTLFLCLPGAGTACVCCHTRNFMWMLRHLLSPSFHFPSFWCFRCLQGWQLGCSTDQNNKKWGGAMTLHGLSPRTLATQKPWDQVVWSLWRTYSTLEPSVYHIHLNRKVGSLHTAGKGWTTRQVLFVSMGPVSVGDCFRP